MRGWNVILRSLAYGWLILAVGTVSDAHASASDWRSLTSFKEVRRIRLIDDTVFAVTSGGLLAIHDVDRRAAVFTNVDGLGTTDLTDIIADADGLRWITGNGRLIRFQGEFSEPFLFFDEDDNLIPLHTVVDDGSFLWIGTEIGLVLFSKTADNGQIQDSYGRFGDLADFPAVWDIWLDGDSIWLATSAGLATADRTDPMQLKSPSRWTAYGSDDLAGASAVNRVIVRDGSAYLATGAGLLSMDLASLSVDVVAAPDSDVVDLRYENDTLFFYYTGGMGFVDGDSTVMLSTVGLPSAPSTGVGTPFGRWVCVAGTGIYENSSGSFLEYPYTGMPENNVSGLTVGPDGILTVGFAVKRFARMDVDSLWHVFDYPVRRETWSLVTDSAGRTWGGTVGDGLWLIDELESRNYDENNSPMRGNTDNQPTGSTYVFPRGLAVDDEFIYAACYRALNEYPLVIGDLDNMDDPVYGWDSLGPVDGLTHAMVMSVDVYGGELAVASEFLGVYICAVGDDPFERPDNCCRHLTEENSWLLSDYVRAVRYSPNGVLWAGTNSGLSRWDLGKERFVEVELPAGIGRDITALEFDGRGNLWVGTGEGLARRDATTGQFQVYSSLQSGLVSDEIRALVYNPYTSDLYVTTTSGISVLPSAIGPPAFEVDRVLAIPNPFVIRSAADRLKFNFAANAQVKIYNAAGEPVRELDTNTPWDGRNQSGETVASGVYLFVLTDRAGNTARGKVLVVQER